jgi:hypothetical protein
MADAISSNYSRARSSSVKRRRNESQCWNYVNINTRNCNVENCNAIFKPKTATTSIIAHLANTHQIEITEKREVFNEDSCGDDDDPIVESCSKMTSHIQKHAPKKQIELDTLLVVSTILF